MNISLWVIILFFYVFNCIYYKKFKSFCFIAQDSFVLTWPNFSFLFHRFSSGQELANLLVSSDLLHHAWLTISELNSHTYLNNPTNPVPIFLKAYPYHSNGAIVAFVSSPTCTLQKEMVTSEDLKGSQFPFDFISTKLNPHFSVNKAAIILFALLKNELSALKKQVLQYFFISLQYWVSLFCSLWFLLSFPYFVLDITNLVLIWFWLNIGFKKVISVLSLIGVIEYTKYPLIM